jgi:concentrative nucleoside transporter, CNT family
MAVKLQAGVGLLVLLLLAWIASEKRGAISWRFVAATIAAQIVLAVLFLKLPLTAVLFAQLDRGVLAIQHATQAGTTFVFGFLGGGPAPYRERNEGASVILAFQLLPLVIVLSALAALLTYWRVLPAIVRAFAWVFERSLNIGGALAVSSAANIFLGMVEAPILVRPFLARFTRSELFAVMCTGLAGVAGTVLLLYATLLSPTLPNAAGHLFVSTVISVPAAIVMARIMVPETATPTSGELVREGEVHGSIEAIMQGTRQGLELFLNIVATLLVFVALVALVDELLGWLPGVAGAPLSLERLFGWVFAPVAWLIGVPAREAATVGALLGTKTAVNELVAYQQLASIPGATLTEHSRLIATYALCGFANFGSVGIQTVGLATMAPARRGELAKLGLRSLLGGTLANCWTAALVGLIT